MTWQDFIKSRTATWLLAPLLLVVMIFAARVFVQKRQIDRQIKNLKDQAQRIQQNNEELSGLIKYFNTPEYQEKQARQKLNLKKDGEYVVVLPDSSEADPVAQTQTGGSHAKLWLDYFFNHSN